MPNTINLRLLDNKQIVTEIKGISLTNANSYRIIAGEENATYFTIISKPNQYKDARYTVEMVNSQGFGVEETNIETNEQGELQFVLPVGMAVAGYGWVQIRAYQEEEIIPFEPLKVKVWNTLPNWRDKVSESSELKIINGYLYFISGGKSINLGYVKGAQGEKGETGAKGEKGDTGYVEVVRLI